MHGTVLRVYSDFYDVQVDGGEVWQTKVLGKLKKEKLRSTLVATGDRVEVEAVDAEQKTGLITSIAPRERTLSRKRPGGGHPFEDVILANPDEVMVVFAAAQPEPHLRMLDRFLVAAEATEVDDIFIVVNKVELIGEARAREMFGLYEQAGYPVIYTSVKADIGIDALLRQLRNHMTVVAGPSGVGKSSLINRIQPGLRLREGEVMDIGKGRHTTRMAELHPLNGGGYIVDTPGLRELGLWDVRPEELSDYFPEIRRHAPDCRFGVCTHIHEPGCAVRVALERGEIHPDRWDSYTRLFHGEE
ncbi:MAG: ribosome small subunit-dependent GTPase A [Caldilineales bacterium]|nr:ribosome small subunit-dependent GTPase A [Caldilineales bacterium]